MPRGGHGVANLPGPASSGQARPWCSREQCCSWAQPGGFRQEFVSSLEMSGIKPDTSACKTCPLARSLQERQGTSRGEKAGGKPGDALAEDMTSCWEMVSVGACSQPSRSVSECRRCSSRSPLPLGLPLEMPLFALAPVCLFLAGQSSAWLWQFCKGLGFGGGWTEQVLATLSDPRTGPCRPQQCSARLGGKEGGGAGE